MQSSQKTVSIKLMSYGPIVFAIFFVVVGVKVYGLQYFRKSLHLSHLIDFYRAAWNADAVLR